jgi:hypothetical protein
MSTGILRIIFDNLSPAYDGPDFIWSDQLLWYVHSIERMRQVEDTFTRSVTHNEDRVLRHDLSLAVRHD